MNRRTALAGAAATGVVAIVAGCETYGDTEQPAAGATLAQLGDVPVGGGIVLVKEGVVLTQPAAGIVKAFSATCTHQGCAVAGVKDGTINCPCHGSRFRVADGSVASGPATAPLPPIAVTMDGTAIRLA